jgi:hypothetical protein
VGSLWAACGQPVGSLWVACGQPLGSLWAACGQSVGSLFILDKTEKKLNGTPTVIKKTYLSQFLTQCGQSWSTKQPKSETNGNITKSQERK